MFKSGGNDVLFSLLDHLMGIALNGPVIGFTAACGKINLVLFGSDGGGDLGTGTVYGGAGRLTEIIQAGSVSVFFTEIRHHGFENLRCHAGRSGVIGIHSSLGLQRKAPLKMAFIFITLIVYHFGVLCNSISEKIIYFRLFYNEPLPRHHNAHFRGGRYAL